MRNTPPTIFNISEHKMLKSVAGRDELSHTAKKGIGYFTDAEKFFSIFHFLPMMMSVPMSVVVPIAVSMSMLTSISILSAVFPLWDDTGFRIFLTSAAVRSRQVTSSRATWACFCFFTHFRNSPSKNFFLF
jgi:hypothetical protein